MYERNFSKGWKGKRAGRRYANNGEFRLWNDVAVLNPPVIRVEYVSHSYKRDQNRAIPLVAIRGYEMRMSPEDGRRRGAGFKEVIM